MKKTIRIKNFKKKEFDKVRKEIISILAMVAKVDKSKIKEDINIRDKLGVESLGAMEILAAIETRFNIKIDTAKAFDVVTVKDLYKLVSSYLKDNYYRKKKWPK